jgi:hypothetical protein
MSHGRCDADEMPMHYCRLAVPAKVASSNAFGKVLAFLKSFSLSFSPRFLEKRNIRVLFENQLKLARVLLEEQCEQRPTRACSCFVQIHHNTTSAYSFFFFCRYFVAYSSGS